MCSIPVTCWSTPPGPSIASLANLMPTCTPRPLASGRDAMGGCRCAAVGAAEVGFREAGGRRPVAVDGGRGGRRSEDLPHPPSQGPTQHLERLSQGLQATSSRGDASKGHHLLQRGLWGVLQQLLILLPLKQLAFGSPHVSRLRGRSRSCCLGWFNVYASVAGLA